MKSWLPNDHMDGTTTLQMLEEHLGLNWLKRWQNNPSVPGFIAQEIDQFHQAHMAEYLHLAERGLTMDIVNRYAGQDITNKVQTGGITGVQGMSTYVPRPIPPINTWYKNWVKNRSCWTYYLEQKRGKPYKHARMVGLYQAASWFHRQAQWDKEQNADPLLVCMMGAMGPFPLPEKD